MSLLERTTQEFAKGLTNDQLLKHLHELTERDHHFEAELIAHLGEVDARRLYLGQACSSMFHYCIEVLRFAEGVAYKRITTARAARKFPEVLIALRTGEIHLTAASLIAPHLTSGHVAEWIAIARHATAREIKRRIADRKPKADVKTSVRRVSSSTRMTAKPNGPPPPRDLAPNAANRQTQESNLPAPLPSQNQNKARSEPLGAERYCIRFVADQGVHEQLEELRSLMRHTIPDGDVAKILARAVGVLLEQVRKRKIAACSSPRLSMSNTAAAASKATTKEPSRHIPAAIRRAVWARDAGRCTYSTEKGRRCGSSELLEFHHQIPWAHCREHEISNIALRCRSHNQYEAELLFGVRQMDRCRRTEAPALLQLDSNPVGAQT